MLIAALVLVDVDYCGHQRLHPGILVVVLDESDAGADRGEDLQRDDYRRARDLCDQYADIGPARCSGARDDRAPTMAPLDAAVLAMTVRLSEPKRATLDYRHFAKLRPRRVLALQILPDACEFADRIVRVAPASRATSVPRAAVNFSCLPFTMSGLLPPVMTVWTYVRQPAPKLTTTPTDGSTAAGHVTMHVAR